jgi:decaprenyl-phosphate phosphoribosyltransferase
LTGDAVRVTAVRARRRDVALVVRGLAAAVRPRQWFKNVLLLAAPAAAGVIADGQVLARSAVAVAAFCAASAAGYLVNDICDAAEDRAHPRKRQRPIASGCVGPRLAVAVAAVLVAVAAMLGAWLGWRFLAALGGYVALTLAYSLALREIAIVDLATVTGCHVLRASAGGLAVGVPLSRWFLIVTCFGALFVVAGRRLCEMGELARGQAATRSTLDEYSPAFLRQVVTLSAAVAITAYCLWAFEQHHDGGLAAASVVPLVLFLLRYTLLLDHGRGDAPEDLVIGDRALGAMAATWVALFLGGVYL